MRVVVDTNVIISATLFENSLPGQALFAALRIGELLLSVETLGELHEVLHRPKFNKYLTVEEREEFLTALTMRTTMVEVSVQIDDCRDPKDNKFWSWRLMAVYPKLSMAIERKPVSKNVKNCAILHLKDRFS